MNRKDEPEVLRWGGESLCTTCIFGKIVTVRSFQDPTQVAMAQRDNPAFVAPPIAEVTESFCVNPILVGGGTRERKTWFGSAKETGHNSARNMGIVKTCELYQARKP